MAITPPQRGGGGGGGNQFFGSLISSALSKRTQEDYQRRQISASQAAERRADERRQLEHDQAFREQQQGLLRAGQADVNRLMLSGAVSTTLPQELQGVNVPSTTTNLSFYGVDPNSIDVGSFTPQTFFSRVDIQKALSEQDPFPGTDPLDTASFSRTQQAEFEQADPITHARALLDPNQVAAARQLAAVNSDLEVGEALSTFNRAVAGGSPTMGDYGILQTAIHGAAERRKRQDNATQLGQAETSGALNEQLRAQEDFSARARLLPDGGFEIVRPSASAVTDLQNVQTERFRGSGMSLEAAIDRVIPEDSPNAAARRSVVEDIFTNTVRADVVGGGELSKDFESLRTRALQITRDPVQFLLDIRMASIPVETTLNADLELRGNIISQFGLKNIGPKQEVSGELFNAIANDPEARVAWAVSQGATDVPVSQLYSMYGQQIQRFGASSEKNADRTLIEDDRFFDLLSTFLTLNGQMAEFGLDGTEAGGLRAISDLKAFHNAASGRTTTQIDQSVAVDPVIQGDPRTAGVATAEEYLERIGIGTTGATRQIVEESGHGVNATVLWFDPTAYPEMQDHHENAQKIAWTWRLLGDSGGTQNKLRNAIQVVTESNSRVELQRNLRTASRVVRQRLETIMRLPDQGRYETIKAIYTTYIDLLEIQAVQTKTDEDFFTWRENPSGLLSMQIAHQMMSMSSPDPFTAERAVLKRLASEEHQGSANLTDGSF